MPLKLEVNIWWKGRSFDTWQ